MHAHKLRMTAAIGLTALTLFLTGCSEEVGGDTKAGNGGNSQKPTSNDSEADAVAKQNNCLRKEGVHIEDAKPGTAAGIDRGDLDEAEMEKAMKKCGLGKAASGGSGKGEMSQADKDKALAFAKCMRAEGMKYEDPDFSSGVHAAQKPPEGDQEGFDAAIKKCTKKVGF